MRRVVRYFGVGAVAASVDISLFSVFAGYFGYNYLLVASITFILATATNYILSIRYVFQSGIRFQRHHEVLLVFGVSAIGLALNQTGLFVGIEIAHLNIVVSKVAATGLVFGWNYAARSLFVFRHPK